MVGRGLTAQASFRQLQHGAPELYDEVSENTHNRWKRSGALKPSGGPCEKIFGGLILHLQELAQKKNTDQICCGAPMLSNIIDSHVRRLETGVTVSR